MIKNLLNLLFLIIPTIFFFFVISAYLSDENRKKINLNRLNVNENIVKKSSDLPILKNDTDNIIEFNSGYNDEIKKKTKRNFWNLLNK